MKTHWQDVHPERYAAIQRWLGETDAKLKVAEVLARDGMRGPGQQAETPK